MLNYKVYPNESTDKWVVFVHGLGGSILTWKKQVLPFQEKYNLIMIDLPGHGKSQTERQVSVSSVNDKIKEVLDKENIKQADFVALSLGTLVTAHFAIKYPEYVKSIIFGGATLKILGKYKKLLKFVQKIKRLVPHRLLYKVFAVVIMPMKNHAKSRQIFVRESLKLRKEIFMDWLDYLFEIVHPDSMLEKLRKTNKRILFITGDEDFCFIKGTEAACKKIKGRWNVIKKCGHVCSIEKGKEFNKLALNFLA